VEKIQALGAGKLVGEEAWKLKAQGDPQITQINAD
jgi:hypothetical protein